MNTRTYEMMKNKIWTFLEVLPNDNDGGLHMLETMKKTIEQILEENEQDSCHYSQIWGRCHPRYCQCNEQEVA